MTLVPKEATHMSHLGTPFRFDKNIKMRQGWTNSNIIGITTQPDIHTYRRILPNRLQISCKGFEWGTMLYAFCSHKVKDIVIWYISWFAQAWGRTRQSRLRNLSCWDHILNFRRHTTVIINIMVEDRQLLTEKKTDFDWQDSLPWKRSKLGYRCFLHIFKNSCLTKPFP